MSRKPGLYGVGRQLLVGGARTRVVERGEESETSNSQHFISRPTSAHGVRCGQSSLPRHLPT